MLLPTIETALQDLRRSLNYILAAYILDLYERASIGIDTRQAHPLPRETTTSGVGGL